MTSVIFAYRHRFCNRGIYGRGSRPMGKKKILISLPNVHRAGAASGEVQPLHNFALPFLKWGASDKNHHTNAAHHHRYRCPSSHPSDHAYEPDSDPDYRPHRLRSRTTRNRFALPTCSLKKLAPPPQPLQAPSCEAAKRDIEEDRLQPIRTPHLLPQAASSTTTTTSSAVVRSCKVRHRGGRNPKSEGDGGREKDLRGEEEEKEFWFGSRSRVVVIMEGFGSSNRGSLCLGYAINRGRSFLSASFTGKSLYLGPA
ncbi:hypothetical protein LR48_Vigan04g245400 [Vigna angularis]|uniref:Uncharacterized protein n=1 Tax=Phaseolus angularis TaxID=3914 RepID=A0A0L9UHS9_PHAAN|nr:hypothetical protein LR48_Vigan04g245400 [Vigna angularis]